MASGRHDQRRGDGIGRHAREGERLTLELGVFAGAERDAAVMARELTLAPLHEQDRAPSGLERDRLDAFAAGVVDAPGPPLSQAAQTETPGLARLEISHAREPH